MQDKMVKLLNQIGMNTDYLENASINKIVVYDNNKLWNFVINNDRILPVYIYNELINKIKVTFSSIDNIKLSIVIDNDCNEYINDYVDNLINVFSNDSYKYSIISTNEEYYTNGVDTYVIVDIGLELSDNYKYVNLVLELKLLKDNKRVFDYLFK